MNDSDAHGHHDHPSHGHSHGDDAVKAQLRDVRRSLRALHSKAETIMAQNQELLDLVNRLNASSNAQAVRSEAQSTELTRIAGVLDGLADQLKNGMSAADVTAHAATLRTAADAVEAVGTKEDAQTDYLKALGKTPTDPIPVPDPNAPGNDPNAPGNTNDPNSPNFSGNRGNR